MAKVLTLHMLHLEGVRVSTVARDVAAASVLVASERALRVPGVVHDVFVRDADIL